MKSTKKRMWQVDFVTLRLFIAVCEEGNIARAAEREAIVASAVSKRIADLEDAIGAPLLLRHRAGVTPTPAGESLLQHARGVLRSVERMQGELSEYAIGVRGHIHIYASVSAIVEFLPEDISGFLAIHDNIKVDLEERVSNDIVRIIEENATAVGVCWDFADTRDLQVIPYKNDHLVAVVHPDHPLASRESVSFGETLEFDQVGQHPGSLMNLFLSREAARLGKSVFNRIHVATFDAACRIVGARLCMSIIPAEAIQPYQAALGLKAVPLTDAWANRRFVICMRDYDALPLPTKLFVDFLKSNQPG